LTNIFLGCHVDSISIIINTTAFETDV